MTTAKEALKLFIQSLQPGSRFAIIPFGSDATILRSRDSKNVWELNDANKDFLIKERGYIDGRINATLGGTEMLEPIKMASKLRKGEF
jgi:hypothetical protein